MSVSILLLLAGVVVLSTATRRPCLRVSGGAWRIWKAGHMTTSERLEACKLRAEVDAQTPEVAAEEPVTLQAAAYLPQKEALPPMLSLVVPLRSFRSPPTLN
jgi:hypothetical protein